MADPDYVCAAPQVNGYRVLDLFSGIGGFSLGLERTGGFKTVAFCEIDPFCRRVLAKHWPDVRQYEDVRELTAERLRADDISVDVICGGFPCQDISSAGAKAGLGGERSGLWDDYARLVGEIRPEFIVVENVASLLYRGLDRVLGDLAEIGFDAEWHCIPASAVGAPIGREGRDRLWILAYPDSGRCSGPGLSRGLIGKLVASVAGHDCTLVGIPSSTPHHWANEPDVARVADGISDRTHRIGSLGNAVVPQIPELIGQAILHAEAL